MFWIFWSSPLLEWTAELPNDRSSKFELGNRYGQGTWSRFFSIFPHSPFITLTGFMNPGFVSRVLYIGIIFVLRRLILRLLPPTFHCICLNIAYPSVSPSDRWSILDSGVDVLIIPSSYLGRMAQQLSRETSTDLYF